MFCLPKSSQTVTINYAPLSIKCYLQFLNLLVLLNDELFLSLSLRLPNLSNFDHHTNLDQTHVLAQNTTSLMYRLTKLFSSQHSFSIGIYFFICNLPANIYSVKLVNIPCARSSSPVCTCSRKNFWTASGSFRFGS